MARLSTYTKDLNLTGKDMLAGSNYITTVNGIDQFETNNFTLEKITEYINGQIITDPSVLSLKANGGLVYETVSSTNYLAVDLSATNITGQLANSDLVNSTITINGTSVALGGSITIGEVSEVIAGTYLNGGGTEGSVTLNHDLTTRTDTTSSISPAHETSFTVIDTLSTNSTGHITGTNAKTITLPSDTTYTIEAIDSSNDALIRLIGSNSTTDDIKLKAGSNIVINVNESTDEIEIAGTAFGNVYTVNSEAAMIAATSTAGDLVVRTDVSKTFIHNGGTTGTAADFTELQFSGIQQIDLVAGDGIDLEDHASNPITTLTQNANDLKVINTLATASERGGIQIGYTENGKNYPVELSSEKAYVNVPWTDTTYTDGAGLDLVGTEFSHTDTSSQTSVNNSGRTYIQSVTLDTFGHVTALTSATETVVNDGNDIDYINAASFSGGTLTLSGVGNAGASVSLDGRYLTGNQTITLSGDVSGSGTTSINVTVANDSHTHDTRYYTETEVSNFFSGTTGITGYNKSNWDTAYSWGNHASAGYLTSFTETDPTVPSHVKIITTTNINNWNTAYGWGNHATQGYITDGNTNWDNSYGFITASSTDTLTNKSGNISMFTNDSGYITDGNTNWNNTYGFITASSTDTLTNKSGNISQWTNDSGYITDGNTNWNNSYGFITASSTDTLTNKSGNISQWTNNSGYLTSLAGSTGGTLEVTGSGAWLTVEGNTGGTTPPLNQGLAFGWNRSNGSNETEILFRSSSAGHNGSLRIVSFDGSTYRTLTKMYGNEAIEFTNAGNINAEHQSTRYLRRAYDSSRYSQLESNSTGGALYMQHVGNSIYLKSYDDCYFANAGQVGFGTTSPTYPIHVTNQVSNTSIYASYDIVAYSDERVKEDIQVIPNALEKVSNIRGVTFKRKDADNENRMAGVIAQEIEKVLPEVVKEDKDGNKAVAYGNVVSLLIEAIKELSDKVKALEDANR